jgi:DNA repair exonuclease SbcCD ATPase subunit
MLELKEVTWQNVLSYGNYPTTLELDNLGQCLIIGEVIDDESKSSDGANIKKSNGAGKSTIPNVIQWILFGRTMHSRNPGDSIVNYFTGQDCWGRLIFKNGNTITRTRKTDGLNELIFTKDGEETALVANTLSTASIQQQKLNKAFNLDWDIFCGSVFFNQYGKPWMEMADNARKKTIERILHVDRLAFYAQAAKARVENCDKVVERNRVNVESAKSKIEQYQAEIQRLEIADQNFEQGKTRRYNQVLESIEEYKARANNIELPDIEKLTKSWALIQKAKERLSEVQKEINTYEYDIQKLKGKSASLKSTIDLWHNNSGKICTKCEQLVDSDHVSGKIEPLQTEYEQILNNIKDLEAKKQSKILALREATNRIAEKSPQISLQEANGIIEKHKSALREVKRLETQANTILGEANPNTGMRQQILDKISELNNKLVELQQQHDKSELLNKHYSYIYKAYNDRSKIKSFIFDEHIPYINSRLQYYLEVFGLDIKIELTNSLSISSNMWNYEFESGGERKRTDVAFMLAMFDFHEQMYGRQCNILVMDEVDGRLDDDGIDALINIIKTDLAHRVESILVISHRNMMFDTFSKEIRVTRQNRFSKLEVL